MNFKNLAMWGIIVLLTIGLYNMFKNPQGTIAQKNNIIFSEFLTEVDNGRVVQVEISGKNIKGVLSNGQQFNTYAPDDPNLIQKLSDKGVSISASPLEEKMPSLLGILLSWFPMLLLIAVWIFFMRQMQGGKGGAMGFGRSKAKMMNEVKGKVTFNDVAGVEEAKEEVEEVVEFLKDPRKFSRLGGKIPRGCLLVGPPGTGKTLLARAIAGEAGVPFFTISGSDFVEMFVGVGASRVRDMFEQGKKHSPCIIFIDEIDAVGRSRGAGLGGGNDEREQTLNQLLVEMDGFDTNEGVIIIAIIITPSFVSKPSISTNNWFRVCSLSSFPPPRPAPLLLPTASISSIKIIQGECFFPCSNMSLTLDAPTPTNISTKSDPDIVKNGTPASPAIALANKVFPVPGGPTNKQPLGIFPPNLLNFLGSFKNSTTSSTSSFASSTPATSLNVTLPLTSFIILAFDLPKPIAPPLPPCICLIKNIQTAIKSNMGNQDNKIPRSDGIFSSNGLAEMLTPLSLNF